MKFYDDWMFIIMYGYIYETTNLINGKKYIGKHKADRFLGERYLGSGTALVNAVRKYGVQNFRVRLIDTCQSNEDMIQKEMYWIKYYDAVKSNKYYNIVEGSSPFEGSAANKNGMYNKVSPNKGKIYIHKENQQLLIHRNEWAHYEQRGWLLGKRKSFQGTTYVHNDIEELRVFPEEVSFYVSKGYVKGRKPYTSNQKGKNAGKSHPAYNKIWVTNGETNKHIHKYELDAFLAIGYRKGMTKQCRPRKYVYKDEIEKQVLVSELEEYLLNGWKLGRPSSKRFADYVYIENGITRNRIPKKELPKYLEAGWKISPAFSSNKKSS